MPGVTIVAEQEGELPEQSANTLETILQAHPDTQIVWAANEGGLVGAHTAKGATGKDIKLFGTDMSLQVAAALKNPSSGLVAVSTQDPYNIGYQSVEAAVQKTDGSSSRPRSSCRSRCTTRAIRPRSNAYLEKYKALAKQ